MTGKAGMEALDCKPLLEKLKDPRNQTSFQFGTSTFFIYREGQGLRAVHYDKRPPEFDAVFELLREFKIVATERFGSLFCFRVEEDLCGHWSCLALPLKLYKRSKEVKKFKVSCTKCGKQYKISSDNILIEEDRKVILVCPEGCRSVLDLTKAVFQIEES